MSGQSFASPTTTGGPGRPQRIIPALPPDIPILPGKLRGARRRRVPRGLIVFLVIALVAGLEWFNIYYTDYDSNRIDPLVTSAVLAHAAKGTQIPVTLWSGPRILRIDSAFPNPAGGLETIAISDVIDPKTGAKDPKYKSAADTVVEGVAITIR